MTDPRLQQAAALIADVRQDVELTDLELVHRLAVADDAITQADRLLAGQPA